MSIKKINSYNNKTKQTKFKGGWVEVPDKDMVTPGLKRLMENPNFKETVDKFEKRLEKQPFIRRIAIGSEPDVIVSFEAKDSQFGCEQMIDSNELNLNCSASDSYENPLSMGTLNFDPSKSVEDNTRELWKALCDALNRIHINPKA